MRVAWCVSVMSQGSPGPWSTCSVTTTNVLVSLRLPWLLEWLRHGELPTFDVPNFVSGDDPAPGFFGAYGTWMGTPPPSWDDVAWLRSQPEHGPNSLTTCS